jgi:hypothetical protein
VVVRTLAFAVIRQVLGLIRLGPTPGGPLGVLGASVLEAAILKQASLADHLDELRTPST